MKLLAVITRVGVALALLSLSVSVTAETDALLRTRVVGQWIEVRKLECEEHQQRMAIYKNGTFEVTGLVTACDANTRFTWRGTWQVKGGKFRYTTTYSDPPEVYPLGEKFEDKIISVTDDEWVMIEQSTGNKSIARKIK